MEEAYIITGYRTAVGKAPRGAFRMVRPDELAVAVIRKILDELPALNPKEIDDVIVGNATPEAEQGLNMARMISLMALGIPDVSGVTINRYCASGLESIAMAVAKIRSGMAHCILAGGVESMSPIPFGGWRIVPRAETAKNNPDWYWGMGLTAEEVARRYQVSRKEQDAFALQSHQRAIAAIREGKFKNEIVPVEVNHVTVENNRRVTKKYIVDTDEGPRADTSLEALARLKPVFDAHGSVTAGNSSQTSDGAAFVLVMSGTRMKELGLLPKARLMSYATVGLEPAVMGVGPVYAIPKALDMAGLRLHDINLIELNEAFASQSVVIREQLGINPDILNVNGGAIALGHPLGCTGTKLTVQVLNELARRNQRYGMVTMCVGTGQGAAGIFELLA